MTGSARRARRMSPPRPPASRVRPTGVLDLTALRIALESMLLGGAGGRAPALAGGGAWPMMATTAPRRSPSPDGPWPKGSTSSSGPPLERIADIEPRLGIDGEPATIDLDRGDALPPRTDPAAAIPDIVARAQRGDAEAFGLLYDRYANVVYRYAYYRVGSAPHAEDLTSETFVRALRRIDTFTWQGRDFGAWLVTIARNLIADHYKSARFRLEVTTADLVGAGVDGRAESPEREVLQRVTNAALLDAVRRLGPEQQECIVLRFLEGMSVAETAHVMGKNDGAIKALQYRAVRSLARLLPEGIGW